MWDMIEYMATATESMICADFAIRFLEKKNNFFTILCFCGITITTMLITTILNEVTLLEGALGFIRIIVCFLLILFLLNGSLFEKIMASFMTELALVISSFAGLSIISAMFQTSTTNLVEEQNYARILAIFSAKLLLFLFTRILIKIKKKNNYLLSLTEWIILSMIFALTIFLETEFAKFAVENQISSEDLFLTATRLCLVAIDILAYFLMIEISRKNEESVHAVIDKMQVTLYENQLRELKTRYDEVRTIRHDMKNHLKCIGILLEENDTERAKKYIQDMTDQKLGSIDQYIQTGNRIVDIIANTKLSQCKTENIQTIIHIGEFSLDIEEIDICIILSNLFDNAIESCRKITDPDIEKIIYLEIFQKKSYVNILIKNTISESVLKKNPDLHTTKQKTLLHGFGIHSIRNVVTKYNGMIDFCEENSCFIADIWIPGKKVIYYTK